MSTIPYLSAKYDDARCEVIAILSDQAEGFGCEAFGDVEAPCGYVQVVVLDESHDLDFSDHTNYPSGDYAGEVAREYCVSTGSVLGMHVVRYHSTGYVSVETFEDQAKFDAYVAELGEIWDAYSSDEDEEG